jgi:hypothetical protein
MGAVKNPAQRGLDACSLYLSVMGCVRLLPCTDARLIGIRVVLAVWPS